MKTDELDDGHIINIGSLAGHMIKKEWSDVYFYSGTKAMVKTLTDGLRHELRESGSNIQVSMISPGAVMSEFQHRMYPGHREEILAYQQNHQMMTVNDVADMVLYILKAPPRVRMYDAIFGPKD
ncbi:dehydrogenase/reductase SDR family member 11-like [Ptychodera flava]|uniref:dehydrogenase/reductase SDR family member 11-like n=1 Tax=Ptychodera flava TaxID=63121 RepID=UPI00396A3629